MTNNQIIFNAAYELMMEGKIGTTGRKITLEDGEEFFEPEPIHTFQTWKKKGYIVKRGEKAIAAIDIWKYAPRKKDNDDGENDGEKKKIRNSEMIIKTSYFFSMAQVEKIG